MRSREREREKERRRRREHEEKTEGRVALRSDSHFFARAVLRSYLLRSFVRLRFSARSMKTHERSKRSRLSYLSLAPPNFSPKLFNTVDHVILPNGNGLKRPWTLVIPKILLQISLSFTSLMKYTCHSCQKMNYINTSHPKFIGESKVCRRSISPDQVQ
ncbi:uncharacterized protein LOC114264538 isoform X3 [Camellia sinensis]|uniref:uncharacterized protein LOC114264538 isoform X3 n=1 Tax=Camellia sinensis TaxID=4442 RepID=UPI001035D64B|nr:uncharacterized protein LOC114264538 isoform X3 [Camellia sinensis]